MKKSKFLKPFSFASLALLMGAAGVFAFAPLGANPNNLASASTMDQINTKADGENIKYAPSPLGLDPENDPVIYTTESGLEIKYGGDTVENSLASGALKGYPYFTMGTYGGYAVNWVIIGRNTNDKVFTSAITNFLFSKWKSTNNYNSGVIESNAHYFFNNTFESSTPAGSAINGVVPSKSYVADYTLATIQPIGNAEVPTGHCLVISECTLGTCKFNASGDNRYGNRYRYMSDAVYNYASETGKYAHKYTKQTPGTLYTYINNLYDSGLGLTEAQKNLIVPQQLKTGYCTSGQFLDTYETDGNTLYPMFPLAGQDGSMSTYGSQETFGFATYLLYETKEKRVAYAIGTTTKTTWLVRSGHPNNAAWCASVQTDGTLRQDSLAAAIGVRPAFIIKSV